MKNGFVYFTLAVSLMAAACSGNPMAPSAVQGSSGGTLNNVYDDKVIGSDLNSCNTTDTDRDNVIVPIFKLDNEITSLGIKVVVDGPRLAGQVKNYRVAYRRKGTLTQKEVGNPTANFTFYMKDEEAGSFELRMAVETACGVNHYSEWQTHSINGPEPVVHTHTPWCGHSEGAVAHPASYVGFWGDDQIPVSGE
jgi:hypothetical protein